MEYYKEVSVYGSSRLVYTGCPKKRNTVIIDLLIDLLGHECILIHFFEVLGAINCPSW